MAGERHNVAFMVGIILGAVGAGAATLLQTPLSGAQTREQLGVRLNGLRPSGVPTHLDSGSYGVGAPAAVGTGDDSGAGDGRGGGFATALRERAQGFVGAGGPIDQLRERVTSLTGERERPAGREGIAPGEAITFAPAGFERAPEALPGSDGGAGGAARP